MLPRAHWARTKQESKQQVHLLCTGIKRDSELINHIFDTSAAELCWCCPLPKCCHITNYRYVQGYVSDVHHD